MPYLMLKKLPRYECLLAAAKQFPELDPSECEAFLHLLRAADDLHRAREASFASANLSCGRFTVLMLLLDKEQNRPHQRTPAELAETVGCTRATITGLVDTLERDGLVRREPDPNDRRMMAVHLTHKGQDLLHSVLPGHFKRMAALMSPLSESDRKVLVRLLAKIATPTFGEEPACATGT
jgi:DNA-binding MarR family transcriptional regulator